MEGGVGVMAIVQQILDTKTIEEENLFGLRKGSYATEQRWQYISSSE